MPPGCTGENTNEINESFRSFGRSPWCLMFQVSPVKHLRHCRTADGLRPQRVERSGAVRVILNCSVWRSAASQGRLAGRQVGSADGPRPQRVARLGAVRVILNRSVWRRAASPGRLAVRQVGSADGPSSAAGGEVGCGAGDFESFCLAERCEWGHSRSDRLRGGLLFGCILLRELAVNAGAMDSQQARRFGDVAAGFIQRALDQFVLGRR
jgi:hypothetical protein